MYSKIIIQLYYYLKNEIKYDKKFKMFKVSGVVNINYFTFLKWYCLNNVLCGIEGVFATHNMFGALNVNNDAFNFSANYIGKDILGQLCGLTLINKFSKYGDKDTKKYIIINSLIYEFASLMESCTPLIDQQYFLFVGIFGNIGRNISFNAFGALKMKAMKDLSSDNNVTEMYTKINVASTVSYSLGMIVGLGLIKFIPCHMTRIGMLPIIGMLRYFTLRKSLDFIIKN